MTAFTNVLREYTSWLTSIRWMNAILPFHLYLLFGGVGLLLWSDLVTLTGAYQPLVYTIGHYAYFLGIILSLAAPGRKFIPFAMWAYVIILLFPFKYFSLYQLIEAIVYLMLGYWLLKYQTAQNQSS
jgi:hypothetical protein